MGDLPGRRDDFDGVDLIPRRPVLDGPVAAGIGRAIAANTAAVAAAGVAGIEEAALAGFFLYPRRNDAGLDDHVHGVFIDFYDTVHPFRTDYDAAAAVGHSSAFQAGPGPPGDDRDDGVIGQADDSRQFFGRRRQDDDVGQTGWPGPFVLSIGNLFIPVRPDIFSADDGFEVRDDGRGYVIILHNDFLLRLPARR